METNCVICKKNTENENSSVRKTKQNRLSLLSNYTFCVQQKSTFAKNKELNNVSSIYFKLNEIIDKFLLAGDKFLPELYLKQPGFIYSASRPFTKHRERISKFRIIVNLKHSYRTELPKACFSHDTAYSDRKDLANRTISDQIFKASAYEIARNRGYDGYQRALASMVYKIFDKKTGSRASVNAQLAEELHRPVIKKFKRRKIDSRRQYLGSRFS